MRAKTIKGIFNWKLPLMLLLFSITFQFVLMILRQYLGNIPIKLSFNTLFEISISFLNLLIVFGIISHTVKWLNKKVGWSPRVTVIRIIIDIVLFSFLTNGWILFINQLVFLFQDKGFMDLDMMIYFCALGTIINLFLIPLIELRLLMITQHQTELNIKELSLENAKFKYEILKNQINPHFLFNSLSVLNPLISQSPETAKSYINSFSEVLRQSLNFKHSSTIRLNEEKLFLEKYIFLLKIRFGESFNAKITIPENHLGKRILPMVLQLLVENIVKHNKMSLSQPMIAYIEATDQGISISNTIRLKSSIASWGIGLNNIRNRYKSLGYTIIVEENNDMFKIIIPYVSKK